MLIKIKDELYNSEKIVSIKKYDYIPKYMDTVQSYDLKIITCDSNDIYIEFDNEEERDKEFDRLCIN